jgi:ATP-dependent Clp protease, protease subunit
MLGHTEAEEEQREGPIEIALVGDLADNESELTDKLLGVPVGGVCTLYIDSPGGSPYCAMSLAALIKLRRLSATAVVTGECSSAALWPFAACERRMVMPYSVFLFHPMKWQSEEHVGLHEAAEWARHFAELEREMDRMLVEMFGQAEEKVTDWIAGGKYVSGRELSSTGLAELIDLRRLNLIGFVGAPANYPTHSARPTVRKRHRSPRLAPVAKARESLKKDRRR